jgi:phosphate transport system permease protein
MNPPPQEKAAQHPTADNKNAFWDGGSLHGGASRRRREKAVQIIFTVAGFACLITMALIVLFLIKEGFGIAFRSEIQEMSISIGSGNAVVLDFEFEKGKGPVEYLAYGEDPDIIDFIGGDQQRINEVKLEIQQAFNRVRGGADNPRPALSVAHREETHFLPSNISDFLLGRFWYPTHEQPEFGILPLILGSLAVTLLSAMLAVPLGVGSALYLAVVAGDKTREIIKPLIELLSSLPSVVLGFIGIVVLAPLMQELLDVPTGLNILNASIMLALMAIPTITSISEDALHSVPRELEEASLALGATRWETLTRVQIPGALSGMGAATILGMSRAMGETMVVLMVAGGAAQIPNSIFDSVRPLPSTIAAEMGGTPVGSDHYFALFAIGIVLFAITLGFNLLAAYVSNRFQQKGAATL